MTGDPRVSTFFFFLLSTDDSSQKRTVTLRIFLGGNQKENDNNFSTFCTKSIKVNKLNALNYQSFKRKVKGRSTPCVSDLELKTRP